MNARGVLQLPQYIRKSENKRMRAGFSWRNAPARRPLRFAGTVTRSRETRNWTILDKIG